MEKFNGLCMVAVSAFQGEKKEDTHGKTNVWLTPIAGKIPNQSMVLAGTVAEQALLTVGGTFLINIAEGKEDPEYGRQFNVTNMGPVPFSEIVSLNKQLGKAEVVITKVVADDNDLEPKDQFQGKIGTGADKEEELSDAEILAAAKAQKLKDKAAEKNKAAETKK